MIAFFCSWSRIAPAPAPTPPPTTAEASSDGGKIEADEQPADRAERGPLADVVGVVLDVDLAVVGVAADEDEGVDLDHVVARERLDVIPVRLGGVRVGIGCDVQVDRRVGLSHSIGPFGVGRNTRARRCSPAPG